MDPNFSSVGPDDVLDISAACIARGMRYDACVIWDEWGYIFMNLAGHGGATKPVYAGLLRVGYDPRRNELWNTDRAARCAVAHFCTLHIAMRVRLFGDDWRTGVTEHIHQSWAVWGMPCDRATPDWIDGLIMIDMTEAEPDDASPIRKLDYCLVDPSDTEALDPLTNLRVHL